MRKAQKPFDGIIHISLAGYAWRAASVTSLPDTISAYGQWCVLASMPGELAPRWTLVKIDMCSDLVGTSVSSRLVGMAGFEPAASCSQINSRPSPGVAEGSQPLHLAASIAARCRLALPGIWRHWLPQLAPLASSAFTN